MQIYEPVVMYVYLITCTTELITKNCYEVVWRHTYMVETVLHEICAVYNYKILLTADPHIYFS